MESEVFLGLGSNLGDREAALEEALRRLCGRGLRVALRRSTGLTQPRGGAPPGPVPTPATRPRPPLPRRRARGPPGTAAPPPAAARAPVRARAALRDRPCPPAP